MEFNAETKLRIYLNHEFKEEVLTLLEGCFVADADPEASWQLFRERLRKLKKKHCNLYEDYMESDEPDDEPTEWQKFKKTRV